MTTAPTKREDGFASLAPEEADRRLVRPRSSRSRSGGSGTVSRACLLLLAALQFLASPAWGQPSPADAPPAPGAGKDIHELLVLANEDYLQGRYEEAARGYEAILARDRRNGHVFYNLGNCFVRLGQVGRAVLSYRKALLLLPRDGDLKANLNHARSLRQDRTEERPPSLWQTLAFWYHALNLRGLFIAFCALNLLFWGSVLLRIFRDSEWVRWAMALSLILTVLMGVSTYLKYRETFHNPDGVVLQAETPVRAGFSHKDTVLFVLHEGTEFRILGQEKGWWKIELPDGKKGWIPRQAGGSVSLGAPQDTVGNPSSAALQESVFAATCSGSAERLRNRLGPLSALALGVRQPSG